MWKASPRPARLNPRTSHSVCWGVWVAVRSVCPQPTRRSCFNLLFSRREDRDVFSVSLLSSCCLFSPIGVILIREILKRLYRPRGCVFWRIHPWSNQVAAFSSADCLATVVFVWLCFAKLLSSASFTNSCGKALQFLAFLIAVAVRTWKSCYLQKFSWFSLPFAFVGGDEVVN